MTVHGQGSGAERVWGRHAVRACRPGAEVAANAGELLHMCNPFFS